MDLPTLKRLWARDRPLIVTSLGNDSIISQTGAKAVALDWGQSVDVRPGVRVVVTRNHHWGSRWGADRNRALWSSFVIETPEGNIFFGGDMSGGDMNWPELAASYVPVRLGFIPRRTFRSSEGHMSSGTHIPTILPPEPR